MEAFEMKNERSNFHDHFVSSNLELAFGAISNVAEKLQVVVLAKAQTASRVHAASNLSQMYSAAVAFQALFMLRQQQQQKSFFQPEFTIS